MSSRLSRVIGAHRNSLEALDCGTDSGILESRASSRLSTSRTTSQIVINALSFKADESFLLRAMQLRDVLHRGAAILQNASAGDESEESEKAFDLSKPVPKIDLFISHNWSTPRHLKFTTLCVHFNLHGATAAAVLLCALLCLLTVCEILPTIPVEHSYGDFDSKYDPHINAGAFCNLVAPVFFLLCLFLQHDALRMLRPSPNCFLDKTCIHQSDPGLKQQGIRKLGAFLASSDYLLILYSNTYLQKLWTIYEVACFSVLHRSCEIKTLHTGCGKIFLQLFVALYLYHMTWQATSRLDIPHALSEFAFYTFAGIGFGKITRLRHRELAATWRLMATFDVKNATCHDESDRPLIETNIAAFMVALGYTHVGANKQQALTAFNHLVRNFVLQSMKASLGEVAVPFQHVVIMMCVLGFTYCLDIASGYILKFGFGDFRTWSYVLATFTGSVAFVPFAAASIDWITSKCLDTYGWKEWVLIVCGSFSSCVLCMVVILLNEWLLYRGILEPSFFNPVAVAFVWYNGISICLSIALIKGTWRVKSAMLATLDRQDPMARTGMYVQIPPRSALARGDGSSVEGSKDTSIEEQCNRVTFRTEQEEKESIKTQPTVNEDDIRLELSYDTTPLERLTNDKLEKLDACNAEDVLSLDDDVLSV